MPCKQTGMKEFFAQAWRDIVGRGSGPFHLRFILQPTVASVLAIRSGLRDSRENKEAYLWSVFRRPESRRELLKSAWKDVGKVFCLAVLIDVVYQFIVLKTVHPLQTLLVATALACVPYCVLRGPVNRLASRRREQTPEERRIHRRAG